MAIITAYNITTTSFSCRLDELDTSYGNAERTCAWYLNGTLRGTVTMPNKISSGGNFAFSGVSASTTYSVRAVITYTGGTTALTASVTTASSSRPTNWAWSSTVASGSAIRISASDWNSFCSRINSFRSYKGLSSYSFTSVSPGYSISASRVNQARTAIDEISGHGTLPSQATTGGRISASFFNGLKDALNAIT